LRHKAHILALTFVESIASILLVRGIYFFTNDRLGFTETQNLWLALGYGIFYIAGAFMSHGFAVRLGEKRALVALIAALLVTHVLLTLNSGAVAVAVLFSVSAALQGLKWPVVESFLSAGETPKLLIRLIGRYNVSWALSVPLGLAASGPVIASRFPQGLFAWAAVLNVLGLLLCRYLPKHPEHLHDEHPERPARAELARYAALVTSARWAMMLSYTLLFLLAPLMPDIMRNLGLSVSQATPTAALLDVGRLLCFALLSAFLGWRSRVPPLVVTIIALPISFALILFGRSVFVVVTGEIIFGLAAGFAYYAALYYALVVQNASVEAGGAHEALIGAGFALGPLVGIAAKYWVELVPNATLSRSLLLIAGPVSLLAALAALLPLARLRRFT
jgi:predicted MFS family arabinose efflux permease